MTIKHISLAKNAAKSVNAAIHTPTADSSYSPGTKREETRQKRHEPSDMAAASAMLSFLRLRMRCSRTVMQTRYGTRQYRIIRPRSGRPPVRWTSSHSSTVMQTRFAAPDKSSLARTICAPEERVTASSSPVPKYCS